MTAKNQNADDVTDDLETVSSFEAEALKDITRKGTVSAYARTSTDEIAVEAYRFGLGVIFVVRTPNYESVMRLEGDAVSDAEVKAALNEIASDFKAD